MENVIICQFIIISILLLFRLKPHKETKVILKEDYRSYGNYIPTGTVVRVKAYVDRDGIIYAICTYSDKIINIPIQYLKEYHL